MDWTAETVAVTGVCGFIGSHLAEALLAKGARVVGVDSFDPFYPRAMKEANLDAVRAAANPGAFAFHEVDCCETDAMASVLEGASGVVHLAAKAGVRPSVKAPVDYASANVVGTMSVLDAGSRAGVERAVVASSSSVYGNNRKTPFSEDDAVEAPISPYAWTKRACELACHTHHHLTGLPVGCLRFFTVFGPRQRPDLAISLFLRAISARETITLYGSGDSSRDYTYIHDIVAGILAAYERVSEHGYRVWNLGSDRPVRLDELVELTSNAAGIDPIIERAPARAGDVERTWADLTRAKVELDYAPQTPIADGIARQWAWMRESAAAGVGASR